MAALFSPHQRVKDNFSTCSICKDLCDNDVHQAKCLHCLHTYCKSCLEKLADKLPKFNCPICCNSITLPKGSGDSNVENHMEYHNNSNSAVSCGSCESGEAVSFCHDCRTFLCKKCEDIHSQFGLLRHHKLSTMVELHEQHYNPMIHQQQHCLKHPKQDITMYCRETDCKIPVCATCGLVDHRGHDLIELSTAIEKIVCDLRQSAAKVNERKQELIHK